MLSERCILVICCPQATEVKVNEVDFNPQFVSRMIPKLEWSALVQAAEEVNLNHDCRMHVTVSVWNSPGL